MHPCTIGEALRFCDAHHAHHDPPLTGLCAVGVLDVQRRALCCVAILARPISRMLDADPFVAEVTRVASDRTPHAASMALAAITRAAFVLGYTRLVSYLLLGEAGTTYRAAGWWPAAFVRGEERDRPARPRGASAQPGDKARWEVGPGCLSCDVGINALVAASAGKILIPPRPPPAQASLWSLP